MHAPRLLIALALVTPLRVAAAFAGPPRDAEVLAEGPHAAGRAETDAGVIAGDDEKLESRLRRPGARGGRTSWQRAGWVRVAVRVDRLDDAVRAELHRAGLAIERAHTGHRLVEGWAPAEAVSALALLDVVQTVHPVERGRTRTGRVVTGGDAASRADLVRVLEGVEGRGVRVGVISDGIDGLGVSQNAGELPAVRVPAGCSPGDGAEGRAMLEIIHDLAPGAELLFASGIDSALAFVDAVECLQAAGAQVIVDDLGFFGEPYFEEGVIAAAVRQAVAAGVSFHTAAGNSAQLHYQGVFRTSKASRFHDFGQGAGVDNVNGIDVSTGGTVLCVLQWDNPFGAAGDDYDLVLLDRNMREVDASRTRQRGRGDPIEVVSGGADAVGVAIERRQGVARTLELFCVSDVRGMEHVTPDSSIFGHAAVGEAMTVAAIDVDDPGRDTVERFSSRGPVELAFPQRETRAKPNVAAFDGVATAVPGFQAFFGTSAAAPHTAAIAALLLERNPFLSPADIRATLMATAVDVGPPGFDFGAGAGRVDALAAVQATARPECFDDGACDDGDACTIDQCLRGRCVPSPAPCDDGDPCNGLERCEPASGTCVAGVSLPDGSPCPDGNVCNGDERCRGGTCAAATSLVCSDGDTCTGDSCDAATGCRFTPLGGVGSIACVLERGLPDCPGVTLPRGVERRFARAQKLIARSRPPTPVRRQRMLVRRAAATLRRASQVLARRRAALPAECVEALGAVLGDARTRARALARGRS